jgi:dimethylaniline monooxygenase (N-oxide forming)
MIFRNATVAKDKRVVVIGGGKSAVDCAIEASRAGASSVTLLQRTANWPTPRMIAGVIPFQYIFLSRLGTALVSAHRGTFPGGSGKAVNVFRNSIVGPALMRPVFALVEELFAFQFNLRGDLRPKQDVVSNFYGVALVLNSDLSKARKAGKITVQTGEVVKHGSDGTLQLKDGSLLTADMVISATGFNQDYSVFDPATLEKLDLQSDGMYLYRYIIPEKVQNLAFVGHVGAISNISTYGLQAEWLARNWTGDLVSGGTASGETVPTFVTEEIEARKKWARSWMPNSANRGMLVLLHQTHYHDQLLRDMGLNPHRKGNVVSEYIMPYEPADYDGIMGGQSTIATST